MCQSAGSAPGAGTICRPGSPGPSPPPPPDQLKAVMTQTGIDVISAEALVQVNAALAKPITVPDQHLDVRHLPEPIGHVTLDLTDIVVSNIRIGTAKMAIASTPP